MKGYHCQVSVFHATVNEVKQRIVRLYEQGADYLRIGNRLDFGDSGFGVGNGKSRQRRQERQEQ